MCEDDWEYVNPSMDDLTDRIKRFESQLKDEQGRSELLLKRIDTMQEVISDLRKERRTQSTDKELFLAGWHYGIHADADWNAVEDWVIYKLGEK